MTILKTQGEILHTPLSRKGLRELIEKNLVEGIDVTDCKGRKRILKLLEIPTNQIEE